MMNNLNHPTIMNVYEYSFDPASKQIFIVLEYFMGRPLFDKLREEGTFDEGFVRNILRQLVPFLIYLHGKGIVYRDLKLENVFYNGSDIKIMDFNFATYVSRGRYLKEGIGVPYYISPEMIKGHYDLRTDIWSLGVITYMMLKGTFPFKGGSQTQIFEAIKRLKLDFSEEKLLSLEAKDLLICLL